MKIKDPKYQPTFNYFGNEIPRIPGWYATDEDGDVFYHECEPDPLHVYWLPYDGEIKLICTVDLEGMDWRDTLIEVK